MVTVLLTPFNKKKVTKSSVRERWLRPENFRMMQTRGTCIFKTKDVWKVFASFVCAFSARVRTIGSFFVQQCAYWFWLR